MQRIAVLFVALVFSAFGNAAASDGDYGTEAEAKAMLDRIVAIHNAEGLETALAVASTAKQPEFSDRDLYIVAFDLDGVVHAHGVRASMIGMNTSLLRDVDGKEIMKALIAAARSGGGFVDYKWQNPNNKLIEAKRMFVRPVDGGMAYAVGIYNPI